MHTSLTYNEGSRCVSLLVTSVVTLSKVIVVWATISRHMAYLFSFRSPHGKLSFLIELDSWQLRYCR